MQPIKLTEKLAQFDDYWSPKIVGELNGQHVKLAKLKGGFVWHHHEHEDELFYVIKGSLVIQFRDKDVTLNPGEFLIIPRGVEHRPIATEEVHVMLFEPATTLNTGNTQNDFTVKNLDQI
jgi:mannose-6-phosphate isomerase-like protein (cupin superfamily)